jgi:hypothetical protein
VLADGQLVESGAHVQLLAQNGRYTRLYRDYARAGMVDTRLGGKPEAGAPPARGP